MHPTLSAAAAAVERTANEERRAAPRHRVTLSANCWPADAGSTGEPGQVRDISTLGVGFLLSRPVELNALLEVELRRPGRGNGPVLLSRVVHVARERPGTWLVGCAFTSELSGDELHLFQAERVRPSGPDCRRWVRFPCNVETVCFTSETVPGEQRPARVVNISAGGIGLLLPCDFVSGTLLRFLMPAEMHQPGREMLVRVVRAMEHASGYWFHGCEFVHQLSEDELRPLLR